MKKRVISILLCLVLCCALLPVTALAAKENSKLTVGTSLNTSTYELTVNWSAITNATSYL